MPIDYRDTKYEGPEAIVVAMDIGTTQSGVSFVYFRPGRKPQRKMVVNWPGQASENRSVAKTPSMVSYRKGTLKACGAEAARDFAEHQENVAYWFKLHLHRALMSGCTSNPARLEIPPLPVGITIVRVYADLMNYLMENTRLYFEKTTTNGAEIWARVRNAIVIVLATPNGWDMREQATLHRAAIRASLVTEQNAGHLLQFVTEASVYYALDDQYGEWLRTNTVFAVVDCGGSTVDTTVYQCTSTDPLRLQETCPSECVQTGGIFVDHEFRRMLERKLEGSLFGNPKIIQSIVCAFESELKPRFDGNMKSFDLLFGGNDDTDSSLGIRNGRITLSNQVLKPIFDAVVNKIVRSCSSIIVSHNAQYVLLVGGFAQSPYVQSVLQRELERLPTMVRDHDTKAAAEGAIIGHIEQFVVARAARATFGGCVRQSYDKTLHRERSHAIQLYADGKERVDDAFHVWITKGSILQDTFAHKLSYHVAWDSTATSKFELSRQLGTIEIEVFAWESDSTPPIWCKDEHGMVLEGMQLICTLNADLSALTGGLQVTSGPRGKRFYRVDYEVCVCFAGPQLRAKLQWKEKGDLREGPIKVMPYVS